METTLVNGDNVATFYFPTSESERPTFSFNGKREYVAYSTDHAQQVLENLRRNGYR